MAKCTFLLTNSGVRAKSASKWDSVGAAFVFAHCHGLGLTAYEPKDALRRFFHRYSQKTPGQQDYLYTCRKTNEGIVAELSTPCFHLRTFIGGACSSKKEAEHSAAAVFCKDLQVISAAECLPPSMTACRQLVGGAGKKRKALA